MPSYVVLARKWRPAQFSDIVGQSHIVRTLMNAIRSERIHQAYLFTGSRGIGKTSIARIFAKVIRCEKVTEVDHLLRSCDQCSNCREITTSSSVDVIEIDGASNNGVEAVREIRENAKYMPSVGMRKIYIIDEVHMLTTAAFNALLKTLEEPPAHVIFIFATTEPHKIPATILSRCQRFDYRRVTVNQIQTRLAEVTDAEGIATEGGALSLIARAAEGGMRDALSLLDQVIAFSGSKITVESVRESVGLIEGQTLLSILSGIFEKKPNESLQALENAYQAGHDLRVLTRSLIEFLHAALLTKIGSNRIGSLELSEEEWNELGRIAEHRTIEEIELIFQVLHQGLEWIARSPQPKIVLDVLIIKCATAESLIYVEPSPSGAPSSSQKSGSSTTVSAVSASPPPTTDLTQRSANFASSIAKSLSSQSSGHLSGSTHPHIAAAPPPVSPSQPPPLDEKPIQSVQKTWESFIGHVRKSRPLLASILEHSSASQQPNLSSSNSDHVLLICFPPNESYFKDQLQSRAYQEQLSQMSKEFFGQVMRFQIELRNAGESLAGKKDREQKERAAAAKERAQTHPVLLEAKSLFGGEFGPIQLREDPHANFSS